MPSEAADAYLSRNTVGATMTTLLETLCKELPTEETLKPYLLAKLRSAYPSAAKTVEVDAAATEWKASGVKITNKSQLAEYLEDVRWGGTSSALMERVLYDRPKNVPAFMIELLAKGDVAPAGPDEMDDDTAAMKMQAMQRGRNARKERKEQSEAATKVAAANRGRKGRKAAKEKKEAMASVVEVPEAADASDQVESAEAQAREAAEEAAVADVLSEDAAATKMQAIQRGKNARKK